MKNPVIIGILISIGFFGAIYLTFFTLPREVVSEQELLAHYEYPRQEIVNITFEDVDQTSQKFTYSSFDGETVFGQISYPKQKADKYPVLIGLHAMGRSYLRWWTDSLKGRPTVTRVNKITEMANNNGYVVIAIDARFHGQRKDPDKSLNSIWNDLHFFWRQV